MMSRAIWMLLCFLFLFLCLCSPALAGYLLVLSSVFDTLGTVPIYLSCTFIFYTAMYFGLCLPAGPLTGYRYLQKLLPYCPILLLSYSDFRL